MPEEGGEQDQDQSEKSEPALIVRMDDSGESDAYINLVTLVRTDVDVFMPCSINPPQAVSCPSDNVRKRVEAVLDMAITTVSSLTESFATGVSVSPEDADPKLQKSISPNGHTDTAIVEGTTTTVEDTITTGEADIAS